MPTQPHDRRYRFAARHHHVREMASTPIVRPRRPTSPNVDAFRPVSRAAQANVAYLGTRGMVSPALGYGAPHQGFVEDGRPDRAQPQARLLSDRDRRRIDGAGHPSGHPTVGRPLISPIIGLGGSDY